MFHCCLPDRLERSFSRIPTIATTSIGAPSKTTAPMNQTKSGSINIYVIIGTRDATCSPDHPTAPSTESPVMRVQESHHSTSISPCHVKVVTSAGSVLPHGQTDTSFSYERLNR